MGGTAIVTGAGGGIGGAITKKLLDTGWNVLALDREAAGLERLVRELGDLAGDTRAGETGHALGAGGATLATAEADVTDRASVGEALAHLPAGAPVRLLVNAAGVSTMQRFADITQEEWDLNLAVNATGTFVVSQVVLPSLLEAGSGCIVNIASVAGHTGAELLAHYSASKFAVVGLTQAAAKELGPLGIRVNAVCPGFIRTAMQDREVVWEGALTGQEPEAVRAGYIALTPLRRLGTPEDVAKLVAFLASSEADFITGQAIHVDGGLLTY